NLQYIWLVGILLGVGLCLTSISCVDNISFGSSFLEKSPGGSATQDTVFSSAVYTRQFLNTCYSRQYYGLPYNTDSGGDIPDSSSPYLGKVDALSDCWQLHYSGTTLYDRYYGGTHTSNYDVRGDVFGYHREQVWEVVRACWMLIENIDKVPDMDAAEKAYLVAQAKCLIAARYFDTFRHYGGIPLVTQTYTGIESSYEFPRATVEETVNFMIELLDEAIASNALFWAYDGTQSKGSYYNPASEIGRWTVAGAMALKCKIWQFAASPLFNDTRGFAGGSSEAERELLVWYGGYRAELWDNCLKACEDFFNAVKQNGYYQLNQATSTAPEQYRQAYRMGYIKQDSKEVLHSVRVTGVDAFNSSTYLWHSWSDNGRNSYTPTQEYVEMFPWSDGTPFDWEKTASEGRLDEMFLTGDVVEGQQSLANIVLTRDPRLYETVRVNGLPKMLGWDSGVMSGMPYELWVGGYDAGVASINETGNYATGYDNMKYYLGTEYQRQYTQWVSLRLSDIYLTYAEALLQAKNDHRSCIEQIDIVRARVGLSGLNECNPDKNLLSNEEALLEELLRERACELGMEDSRYFDLVRYKRADMLERPLHGLLIYRLDENGNRIESKWYEGDYGSGAMQPTRFDYEKFQLINRARYWWTYGFHSKWYLSPLPLSEINKDYGLIQNPGW
ncbi:MAG: RagB/SusD family nutrient uptake outer membrane protein, partial [Bacteroides sp.]|nr:RagB/SusD family nutrient uptake outer membrane protein [Bacteroides sp.]